MIGRLVCFFRDHQPTYLQRRKLHGLDVQHLVCPRCLRCWPAVERTDLEHAAVIAEGAIRLSRARLVKPDNVASLRRNAS